VVESDKLTLFWAYTDFGTVQINSAATQINGINAVMEDNLCLKGGDYDFIVVLIFLDD
jgi:hypothetical protein